MTDIFISKFDNVHLKITSADYGLLQDIAEYFSFRPEGYRFMPSYKNGMWDGYFRLFQLKNGKIYIGLLSNIVSWLEENDLTYEVDKELLIKDDYNEDYIKNLVLTDKGKEIKPYDYQYDIIKDSITYRRKTIISPTSSGKSLTIYGICRYLLDNIIDKKILIIVPSVGLTKQLYSDFDDYSEKDDSFNADDEIHIISSGADKNTEKGIIISTWQSIYKLHKKWFDQFDAVICDEVHQAKAKSICGIMEKCQAEYKIGLTGTLNGDQINELTIIGLFGSAKKYISTKELMDSGKVTELNIKAIQLIHNDTDKNFIKTKTYQEEIDFLIGHQKRNEFMVNIAIASKNNTLILFNRISHGKLLKELIEAKTERKVFYIDGSTKAEEREQIRKQCDLENDAIMIFSYGTSSTGISIKNIHNIIFAAPYKSKIKVLQSIGRGLRKHHSKDKVTLFDITDNLTWKKKINYTLLHFMERYKIYMKEKFNVTTINHKL